MFALVLAILAAGASPVEVDRIGTRLVADHDGRRTVLARGVIGGYSVSGRRVAYVEARGRAALLHVVRVSRRVRRLETLILYRRRRAAPLDVVLTSRGELAWLTPRGVVMRRPGRRPRLVARGRYHRLALEDDRTLRFGGGGLTYFDLRPFPGCGGRSRFHTVFDSAEVLVTQATYERVDQSWNVLRACRRADGRDPVVASTHSMFPDGAGVEVAGADRDWVVIVHSRGDRYGDSHATVRTVQAGSGLRGPAAAFYDFRGDPDPRFWLPFGGEVAVSDAGVSAWVSQREDLHRLLAIPRAGTYRVLDSGLPGSLANLAFDGAALTWTHDGVARSEIP